jgi:hypothetical protein
MINETISLFKSAILSSMVVIPTLFKHGRTYVGNLATHGLHIPAVTLTDSPQLFRDYSKPEAH